MIRYPWLELVQLCRQISQAVLIRHLGSAQWVQGEQTTHLHDRLAHTLQIRKIFLDLGHISVLVYHGCSDMCGLSHQRTNWPMVFLLSAVALGVHAVTSERGSIICMTRFDGFDSFADFSDTAGPSLLSA
jgi:hypothetical protein